MNKSKESFTKCEDFVPHLTSELKLGSTAIKKVIELLQSGNTVPFIARYRKEATGNLDEVQIRAIEERHKYLVELEDRRVTILSSIDSLGKLDEALKKEILACTSKTKLEDLYLPYKPKRRTRAMIAKEKGLSPLAELILAQPLDKNPANEALKFINAELEVADIKEALRGAIDIVAEQIAEHAQIRSFIREQFDKYGVIVTKVKKDVSGPTKFEQYYDFKEPIATIPSHRFLAIARGQREQILLVDTELDPLASIAFIKDKMNMNESSAFSTELNIAIEDAYKRLLIPSLTTDVWVSLKMRSDREAINVFAENLKQILLASPLGAKTVIGIDPGLRTGCKCAVVQDTGKFIVNTTLYITGSDELKARAEQQLLALIETYKPIAIAVGNGTGGRETEAMVKKCLNNSKDLKPFVVSVSESGASVYSASEIAREEFPDLDLTVRGAISIARRLQDPLAELVKVEPKAMGVGQYQHDVFQPLLEKKLLEVVESAVNQVGVEINTASAALLSYIAGIGPSLAKSIVAYRETHGAFKERAELINVPGLGPKTYEQAAGFLRVFGGANPLDASAVHPERYGTIEQIARDLGMDLKDLIGNNKYVDSISIKKYLNDELGELTLKDIINELKKPGRDPRAQFEPPAFRDDVNTIADLKKGMRLEGVVTNVTAFGAFVDIGVHQDGLVHISELSNTFVRDASSVVQAGEKIMVEVIEIDSERKRIALSAKRAQEKSATPAKRSPGFASRPNQNASLGSVLDFSRFKRS